MRASRVCEATAAREQDGMIEDLGFNLTLLTGCLVGAVTGYHKGGIILSLDGLFIGLAAAAMSGAFLAELADALWNRSKRGSWLLERTAPLITLALLVGLARQFWS